jgi:shikimate dehydrogenase
MSQNKSNSINAATRICAVYGHPIKHSASPTMQNAGIRNLDLNWRYVAFDVHPDNLRDAIAGARAMRFIGLNLTVPHKLLALEMVDAIDPAAKHWGAINTIRFEARVGNEWQPLAQLPPDLEAEIRSVGFNTDADAIVRSLKEDLGVRLPAAKILLLGAGGAGRTAALRLAQEDPAELFLVNRTTTKADELANEIRQLHPQIKVELGYPNKFIDLAINATSLGLKPDDPLPINLQEFPLAQAEYVYDMIYKPAKTPFLAAASESGCFTANGLGMLLYQGAKALEIWSGMAAPIHEMREALTRHIYGDL